MVCPTLAASFSALIRAESAMTASKRSCFSSSGTGSGSAFAAAPSTGSNLNAPTRSSCASSSQFSR